MDLKHSKLSLIFKQHFFWSQGFFGCDFHERIIYVGIMKNFGKDQIMQANIFATMHTNVYTPLGALFTFKIYHAIAHSFFIFVEITVDELSFFFLFFNYYISLSFTKEK